MRIYLLFFILTLNAAADFTPPKLNKVYEFSFFDEKENIDTKMKLKLISIDQVKMQIHTEGKKGDSKIITRKYLKDKLRRYFFEKDYITYLKQKEDSVKAREKSVKMKKMKESLRKISGLKVFQSLGQKGFLATLYYQTKVGKRVGSGLNSYMTSYVVVKEATDLIMIIDPVELPDGAMVQGDRGLHFILDKKAAMNGIYIFNIGLYNYTDSNGTVRTVSRYTTSQEKYLAWQKQSLNN